MSDSPSPSPSSSSSSSSASSSSRSISPYPVLPVSPQFCREPRAGVEELLPLRILIAAVWILVLPSFVTMAAVVQGCLYFIANIAGCIALTGIFMTLTFPVVYAIFPGQIQDFRFVSLCPIIEVILVEIDKFLDSSKRVAADKLNWI